MIFVSSSSQLLSLFGRLEHIDRSWQISTGGWTLQRALSPLELPSISSGVQLLLEAQQRLVADTSNCSWKCAANGRDLYSRLLDAPGPWGCDGSVCWACVLHYFARFLDLWWSLHFLSLADFCPQPSCSLEWFWRFLAPIAAASLCLSCF